MFETLPTKEEDFPKTIIKVATKAIQAQDYLSKKN